MKNLLLFLGIALIISSCADNKPKDVTISGQLMNKPDNFGLLMSKGLTDTIKINDDGTFLYKKSLDSPSYFNFRVGRAMHTIFLLPGDSLFISLDLENRSNDPVFSGSKPEICSYILNANKVTRNFTSNFRSLYSSPFDVFTAKIDSVKADVLKMLENDGISESKFIALEKERLQYFSMGLLFDYPAYNARLTGKEFNPDSADYSFMNNLNMNIASQLHINEYASLVNKYIQNLHWNATTKPENKGKSRFETKVMLFELIDSLIIDPEVRDFVKHQSVIETIQWESLDDAKNLVEHYMKEVVVLPYKNLVEIAFAKRMLLAPGVDAPAFKLTGIDGKEYSLSDFSGKLVYIDFWASWCGPCRAEIPYLLKLKEAYKDKPVAFVAISLDDDIEAWKNMVAEKELKGYQLHATKAWSSDVAKNYQIKGVPTFVLIDGNGKIIEYNVARPSDPDISLIFDRYLKTLN